MLLTTHYMEEAERLCDEVLIIDHGKILASGSPASLIKQYVEPEVLELHGSRHAIEGVLDHSMGCRVETVGETAYCYTRDSKPLTRRLQETPELTFLHRPANLEDVFLTITGRDLRE